MLGKAFGMQVGDFQGRLAIMTDPKALLGGFWGFPRNTEVRGTENLFEDRKRMAEVWSRVYDVKLDLNG